MQLEDLNKNLIIEDCENRPHEEACGILIQQKDGVVEVIPCENKSPTPKKSFIISQETIDKFLIDDGKLISYYHSHIRESENGPSWLDKAVSEQTKLESIVYNIKTKKFFIYSPMGWTAPLLGREYAMGFFDSFSLVKDVYKNDLKIYNNFSYSRYTKPLSEISVNNKGILLRVFQEYGFNLIPKPINKCLCLMTYDGIESECGIYCNDEVLMHKEHGISGYKSLKEVLNSVDRIRYFFNGKLS